MPLLCPLCDIAGFVEADPAFRGLYWYSRKSSVSSVAHVNEDAYTPTRRETAYRSTVCFFLRPCQLVSCGYTRSLSQNVPRDPFKTDRAFETIQAGMLYHWEPRTMLHGAPPSTANRQPAVVRFHHVAYASAFGDLLKT